MTDTKLSVERWGETSCWISLISGDMEAFAKAQNLVNEAANGSFDKKQIEAIEVPQDRVRYLQGKKLESIKSECQSRLRHRLVHMRYHRPVEASAKGTGTGLQGD